MQTSLQQSLRQYGLPAYAAAICLLIPAVSAWYFSLIFLVPRLRELWDRPDFAVDSLRLALSWSAYLAHHGLLLVLGLALVFFVLEWRSSTWPRLRRFALGALVFFVNTAVLVLLTSLFTTALSLAVGLSRNA